MESLLDWLNARTFAAAAIAAGSIWAVVVFQETPRRWYQDWRYPHQAGRSPLSAAIDRDLEAHASLRLKALHREVRKELARAREEGFSVAPLEKTADLCLEMDAPAFRAEAVERLQKLRRAIPRRFSR